MEGVRHWEAYSTEQVVRREPVVVPHLYHHLTTHHRNKRCTHHTQCEVAALWTATSTRQDSDVLWRARRLSSFTDQLVPVYLYSPSEQWK